MDLRGSAARCHLRPAQPLAVVLVLNAEVRRQVAAKKVEALIGIAVAARTVGEDVYCVLQPDDSKRHAAVDGYWSVYRAGLVLLDPATCTAIENCGNEASAALGASWDKAVFTQVPGVELHDHAAAVAHDPDLASELMNITTRWERARDVLFEAIRRELQLTPDGADK